MGSTVDKMTGADDDAVLGRTAKPATAISWRILSEVTSRRVLSRAICSFSFLKECDSSCKESSRPVNLALIACVRSPAVPGLQLIASLCPDSFALRSITVGCHGTRTLKGGGGSPSHTLSEILAL